MQIIISLPKCDSANTYQELNAYLKQLELAVHHAQKSVESAEKNEIKITEDNYICFRHPQIDNLTKSDIEGDNELGIDYYDELQEVSLEINLD